LLPGEPHLLSDASTYRCSSSSVSVYFVRVRNFDRRDTRKMPDAGFFRKLGLFVDSEFLGAATCARVVAEIRAARAEKGIVVGQREVRETGGAVDESGRKVWHAQISESTESEISDRMESLRPKLERHFNIRLSDREGPNFLRYDQGGFHKPHRDSRPSSPLEIRRRAVSVVVFLNPSVDSPATVDGYGGGELILYGLIDDPKWKRYGFTLDATPGLLIAYRSYEAHEIKPVKFGQRFSIVTWFLQDSSPPKPATAK
jgi:SM-20-related protein